MSFGDRLRARAKFDLGDILGDGRGVELSKRANQGSEELEP